MSELVREVVSALGGVRYLALECGVSTWTVRAWMAGTRFPAPASHRRIQTIGRDFGLTGEQSGRYPKTRAKKKRKPR